MVFLIKKYKKGSDKTCLAVALIDFVLKKIRTIKCRSFSKKLKYIEKEKKVIRYISDGLEIFLMSLQKE